MTEKKQTKIERFNVYSDEVEEVLSRPPRWLFIMGNSIIAMVVLSLLVLSWFVRYPDVVTTVAEITTELAPTRLISRTDGLLKELEVLDGAAVQKGDVLAVITSDIDYHDFVAFQKFMDSAEGYLFKGKEKIIFPKDLQLGNLTLDYAELKTLFQNYITLSQSHPYYKEASKIKSQVRATSEMITVLEQTKTEAKQQTAIAEKNLIRQRSLHKDELISTVDLEKVEFDFMSQKSKRNELEYRIKELESSIQNLNRQYEGLNKTERRRIADLKSQITEVINRIKAKMSIWESQHLIRSNSAGICSYLSFIQNNQAITKGQELFVVSPDSSAFIVRGRLPIRKSGLVKPGQKVILKLPSYPYKEYGVLTGKVSKLSLVPDGDGYMFFVTLDNSLLTNFNKQITYKPQMKTSAEIVLEDLRLIERVFYEIKNIITPK